jgi:hypothetical protein
MCVNTDKRHAHLFRIPDFLLHRIPKLALGVRCPQFINRLHVLLLFIIMYYYLLLLDIISVIIALILV